MSNKCASPSLRLRLIALSGLAIGTGGLTSPSSLGSAFGVDTQQTPGSAVIIRSAAARDVALAAGLWRPASTETHVILLRARATCDLLDSVACLIGLAKGAPRFPMVVLACGGLVSALLCRGEIAHLQSMK